MPAFAPIVLVDNSPTTPVNHTYQPTSNGVQALFTDRAPEKVMLWPKLSSKVTAATSANGKSDSVSTLSFPVAPVTEDGCCSIAELTYITVEIRAKVSSLATAAERASALAIYRAWVASSAFAATFAGESFY